jgi:uncharacterized OB-fold protein
MPAGIAMRRCGSCGHVVFPPRPLCPRCGGRDWRRAVSLTGVVEEVTWRRPRRKRMQTPLGHWVERSEVQLASVRSDLGPVLTVLAPGGDLEPGMTVGLESEASVSIARESAELRARRAGACAPARPPAEGEPLPGEWAPRPRAAPPGETEVVPGEWIPEPGSGAAGAAGRERGEER